MIIGGDTHSPEMKDAIDNLQRTLPHPTLLVVEGQQHNAMDGARERLAAGITSFLLGKSDAQ